MPLMSPKHADAAIMGVEEIDGPDVAEHEGIAHSVGRDDETELTEAGDSPGHAIARGGQPVSVGR